MLFPTSSANRIVGPLPHWFAFCPQLARPPVEHPFHRIQYLAPTVEGVNHDPSGTIRHPCLVRPRVSFRTTRRLRQSSNFPTERGQCGVQAERAILHEG